MGTSNERVVLPRRRTAASACSSNVWQLWSKQYCRAVLRPANHLRAVGGDELGGRVLGVAGEQAVHVGAQHQQVRI